jgi:pyruvate carboxylase
VKVTPSSKVVGDLAIFLVSHGITVAQLEKLGPDHQVAIPNSVVDMFEGSLGVPEGGWPKHIQDVILRGKTPREGRPGAQLAPTDFDHVKQKLTSELEREPSHDEVLSYVMYPDVFLKFAKAHQNFGDVEALPSVPFFYGMEPGEEITVEIEPGKVLIIKLLTIGEPHTDGYRTVFFELNGRPREVDIRDKGLKIEGEQREKANPANPNHVGAPLPGMVTTVAVHEGQTVQRNERLLVIEAMKMQSTIYAPHTGKIVKLYAEAGKQVDSKDLLMVMEAI